MAEPEMCADCATLVGGGRNTRPHHALEAVGKRRETGFGGMVCDQQDYRCTQCGTEWMHESGNSGFGWTT